MCENMTAVAASAGMSFGEAIQALKNGKRIQRKGWNGKSQYCALASCCSFVLPDGYIVNCNHQDIGNQAIAFFGTSGIQIGWLASQADMLADDWQLVEQSACEPTQLHGTKIECSDLSQANVIIRTLREENGRLKNQVAALAEGSKSQRSRASASVEYLTDQVKQRSAEVNALEEANNGLRAELHTTKAIYMSAIRSITQEMVSGIQAEC